MRRKIYYFPPYSHNYIETNPYSHNFKEALSPFFEIVEKDKRHRGLVRLAFLKNSWNADVYVLNWIESINKGIKNIPLFIVTYLAIVIILLRKRKIVWVFHNIHPHSGENLYSHAIQTFLFRHASLIVTHSKEAEQFLMEKQCKAVKFYCHPVKIVKYKIGQKPNVDVFIWGSILPYKGIPEFLEENKNNNFSIRIIGKCNDTDLTNRIKSYITDNVVYENRYADYDEIASWCQASRFVLFPYTGESVSSSGALIDTLAMGGVPLGPNIGAFKDLNMEGVCFTYKDYNRLFEILKTSHTISSEKRDSFLSKNSWSAFGINISHDINSL